MGAYACLRPVVIMAVSLRSRVYGFRLQSLTPLRSSSDCLLGRTPLNALSVYKMVLVLPSRFFFFLCRHDVMRLPFLKKGDE